MQISWVGQSTKHHGATPIQDGIFIISIQVLRCPILYIFPLFIENRTWCEDYIGHWLCEIMIL